MYKIIQGLNGIDMSIFLPSEIHLPPPEVINTRFSSIQYTTMLEPNFFLAEFSANMWNNLPSDIIEAPSLNSFKSLLDNYWNNIMYDIN